MRTSILNFFLALGSVAAIPAYGVERDSFYLGVSMGEMQFLDADEGFNSFAPGQTFGQITDSRQLTIGYQINRNIRCRTAGFCYLEMILITLLHP